MRRSDAHADAHARRGAADLRANRRRVPSPSIRSRRSRPSSRDLRRSSFAMRLAASLQRSTTCRLPRTRSQRSRRCSGASLRTRTTTARTTSRPALRIAGTASSCGSSDTWIDGRVSSTSSRSRVRRSWSSSPLLPLATSRCPRREVIRPAAAGMSSSPSRIFKPQSVGMLRPLPRLHRAAARHSRTACRTRRRSASSSVRPRTTRRSKSIGAPAPVYEDGCA